MAKHKADDMDELFDDIDEFVERFESAYERQKHGMLPIVFDVWKEAYESLKRAHRKLATLKRYREIDGKRSTKYFMIDKVTGILEPATQAQIMKSIVKLEDLTDEPK